MCSFRKQPIPMYNNYANLDESSWSVDFSETLPLLMTRDQLARHERRTRRKISTNVGALVVGMGILTMGMNPIDDLQSSLNAAGELGVSTLGIKYGTMILANLLTNTFLIRKLGSKRALISGAVLSSVYIVANFYPIWATLVPLSMVAGFGGALMWTTLSNYLARMAVHYADLTGAHEEGVMASFFGIMGSIGYGCAALGGLASFFILDMGFSYLTNFPIDRYALCGPNYCNEELLEGGPNPTVTPSSGLDMVAVYGLCSFCLAVTLFAVVILGVLVHPLPSLGIVDDPSEANGDSSCGLLLATMGLWRKPKLLLLVPMSVVYGFQEAFWRVEFSKAYVTCALGTHSVGFLFVFYNMAAMISSFLCRWMGKRNRRRVAFPFLVAIDITTLVCMLYWHPTADDLPVAFIVTGVSGITYGGLSTLLLAYFGMAFPNSPEAAYSNLYFWSFLGSTLMYAWSFNLCLKVKLLVVLALVIVAIFGYAMSEVLLESEEREKMILKAKEHRKIISKRMLVPAGF